MDQASKCPDNYRAYEPNWMERLAIKVVKSRGHVPLHYAFILDGNRRFARRDNKKAIEGHKRGSDTVEKVGLWGNGT